MSNSKISVNIGDLFIDEYNSAYIVINKYYEAINNDKVSNEIVGFVRFYDIKKGITIEHPENLILELTNIDQKFITYACQNKKSQKVKELKSMISEN